MSPNEFVNLLGHAYGIGSPSMANGLMMQMRSNETQRELLSHGTIVDTSKAQSDLDWQAKIGKTEGIDKMMLFWRAEDAGAGENSATMRSDSTELVTT